MTENEVRETPGAICESCGKQFEDHAGLIAMCRDLVAAKQLLARIHQLVEDDLTANRVPGDLSHWTIEAETRQYNQHAKAAE